MNDSQKNVIKDVYITFMQNIFFELKNAYFIPQPLKNLNESIDLFNSIIENDREKFNIIGNHFHRYGYHEILKSLEHMHNIHTEVFESESYKTLGLERIGPAIEAGEVKILTRDLIHLTLMGLREIKEKKENIKFFRVDEEVDNVFSIISNNDDNDTIKDIIRTRFDFEAKANAIVAEFAILNAGKKIPLRGTFYMIKEKIKEQISSNKKPDRSQQR